MKWIILVLMSFSIVAQESSDDDKYNTSEFIDEKTGQKIIYKYQKHQKIDFEDLVIGGDTGSPGDLSISPRLRRRFKNKLPYRLNFNAEIRKGIERIR